MTESLKWLTTVIWMGLAAKLVYDQWKLFKAYRKKVNPPYPLLPNEHRKAFPNDKSITRLTSNRIRVVFQRHTDKDLRRLAGWVYADIVLLVLALVLIVIGVLPS